MVCRTCSSFVIVWPQTDTAVHRWDLLVYGHTGFHCFFTSTFIIHLFAVSQISLACSVLPRVLTDCVSLSNLRRNSAVLISHRCQWQCLFVLWFISLNCLSAVINVSSFSRFPYLSISLPDFLQVKLSPSLPPVEIVWNSHVTLFIGYGLLHLCVLSTQVYRVSKGSITYVKILVDLLLQLTSFSLKRVATCQLPWNLSLRRIPNN